MTTERPLLEVDGVGVSFRRRQVLKSASFSARAGRVTTLMGRNGSGKTTLLRAAVGRIRPEWGRVLWRGEYLERPSLPELARRGVLYSAQESALTGRFTVRAHLEAFREIYARGESLDGVLEPLRLAGLLDLRPGQLSGGEKQRVTLGLAMLRRPSCLLMDEPFAGVAPIDLPLITEALLALRREGVAIVISGHEVADLFTVADDVIWVVAGTTHWLGTPRQASEHHEFRRSYLGPLAIQAAP